MLYTENTINGDRIINYTYKLFSFSSLLHYHIPNLPTLAHWVNAYRICSLIHLSHASIFVCLIAIVIAISDGLHCRRNVMDTYNELSVCVCVFTLGVMSCLIDFI